MHKDSENKLKKDSIVKCDDLIKLSENYIKFKIGEVNTDDFERFINTYSRYLDNN